MAVITKFFHGSPYEPQWGGHNDSTVIAGSGGSDGGELRLSGSSFIPNIAVTRAYLVSQGTDNFTATVSLPIDLSGTYTLLFGVQDVTTWDSISCYGLRLRNGTQELELIRRDNGSETSLNRVSRSSQTGFTDFQVIWYSDDDITGYVGGDSIDSSDGTYTNGGIGFHCNPADRTEITRFEASSYTDNRPAAPGSVSVSST